MSDLNQLDRVLTSILEESWEIFWKDVLVYLLATVLYAILIGVSLGLLSGVATVGFALLVHRRRSGEDVGAGAIFSGFGHVIGATLATLVIAVGVTLGLALLVLPGLFLLAAWSMTFSAMAIEDLGAGEALSRSYQAFKDHSLLVVVLLIVLGIINAVANSLIFGGLLSTPFSLIASVVAYEKLAVAGNQAPRVDQLKPHGVRL